MLGSVISPASLSSVHKETPSVGVRDGDPASLVSRGELLAGSASSDESVYVARRLNAAQREFARLRRPGPWRDWRLTDSEIGEIGDIASACAVARDNSASEASQRRSAELAAVSA